MLTVGAAAITPVVGAAWWLARGADDPIDRRDARVLPVYVANEAELPDRTRTLVLNSTDDGRITYALLRSSGPLLGHSEIGPPPEDYSALSDVVADLVSGRGGIDGGRFAEFAAKYVYLPKPVDPDLANILDSVPGLVRSSAPDQAAMWRVEGPVARVWIANPDGEGETEERSAGDEDITTLPSGSVNAFGNVPNGPSGRLLVVSELPDEGWSATLNGESLTAATYDGWAQAFELPEQGGIVRITHQGEQRQNWLWFQLAVVAAAVVLAAPGMRRQRGAIDAAAEMDTDDTDPGTGIQPPVNMHVQPTAAAPAPVAQPMATANASAPTVPVPTATTPTAAPDYAAPEPGAPAGGARERRQGGHRRKKGRTAKRTRSSPEPRARGGKRAAGKRAKGRRRDGGEQ